MADTNNNEKTYPVDTRNYHRKDFVQNLLANVCGSAYGESTADELIKYLDEQVDITDFDGEVMSAERWRDDIEAELE